MKFLLSGVDEDSIVTRFALRLCGIPFCPCQKKENKKEVWGKNRYIQKIFSENEKNIYIRTKQSILGSVFFIE